MSLLQQLLKEEHANSRFIYLLNGVGSVFCVSALVLAAIWVGVKGADRAENIIDAFGWVMMIVLSGGVGLGAAGRWLTNKKGNPHPPVESTETTTTTTEKTIGPKV